MESLIVTAIFAIASGVAFLAYHHPKEFAKIEIPILAATLFFWFIGLAWFFGTKIAFSEIIPYIETGKYEAAKRAVSDIQPNFWVLIVLPNAIIIYLRIMILWVSRLKNKGEKTE